MAAIYPADTFKEGVDLTIEASNQLARVVRGDANTEVTVADGSTIPSIRKAQTDSMYFKEPELWMTGQTETDYLQLKKYIAPTTGKESWWFAKGALVSNPIAMGTSPFGDNNWTLYTPEDLFIPGKAEYESIYQALKGKAAEAGYNLVRGSFEEGGTLTNDNDVLWYQANGKYYSWAGTLPKVVAAGATPATSGGIGAGAWVDRTDVVLRDQLAGDGGAGLVGFSGGDLGLFAARTVADAMKVSMRFDDFKGDTDDEKWASMAAYLSMATVTSISVVFSSRIHSFSTSPAQLVKPFTFLGAGARSTVLKFTNCNGVSADLSAYGSIYIQSKIAHMSLVANSSNSHTGVYFKGSQSFAPHDPALVLDNVSLFGLHGIDNAAPVSTEWSKAVHLFDVDEVHMHDVYICGADSNANYASRTTSKAIYADTITGLRIDNTNIFLCGTGLEVTGQSEGLIGDGLTIVAVNKGILFRGLGHPANNHCISNTHISSYEHGIYIEKPTNDAYVYAPIANYFTNIFILERQETENKGARFVGVDVATKFSKFTNVTVWANANADGVHEKIGFRIANGGNTLHNCHSHRMTYSIETFDIIPLFAYDVAVNDFHDDEPITGFLSPVSTKQVAGMVRTNFMVSRTWNRPINFTDQFTLVYQNGTKYFDVNAGVITLKSPTGHVTNFRHVPNTSTDNTPGATLIGIGGTTTENKGNWILRSTMTQFSGILTPEVANSGLVGSSVLPFAGGFTQTAYTITSDERMKTAPLAITDAMLDAAADVDWVQYQYLDRVEAKGPDGARWHFGAVAQRYVEAFQRHGLDAHDFGFICYDEWDAAPAMINTIPAVLDDDGNEIEPERTEVVSEAIEAGSRYGIRYEEALALEAALQRRNYQRLLARVEALEAK